MKHNMRIISLLVLLFLVSQILGLFIVTKYIDQDQLKATGELGFEPLPGGIDRPHTSGNELLLIMIGAIFVGTILLLVLAKFKSVMIWKIWYTFSVIATLFFAFDKLIGTVAALILGITLAIIKVFRGNIYAHNLTEIFIYGGLAAIFVPIEGFTVFYAFLLLVLISIYDMYAVWKSKHMVALADFTSSAKLFAGLSVPYNLKKGNISKKSAKSLVKSSGKIRNAILGGGDIGFPLLFSGAILKSLIADYGMNIGFLLSLIVPLFSTISLIMLFIMGKKNKFYPAMPYLTAGCVVGFGVLSLVTYFV